MTDLNVFDAASQEMRRNRSAAVATVTAVSGSVPQVPGAMLCVREDGTTVGTVGGGKLEAEVIRDALACLKSGEGRAFSYELTEDEGALHMQCGGTAEVFIKVMAKRSTLLVFGGGHIALELAALSERLGYYLAIYDDREEFCNPDRFPQADELHAGALSETFDPASVDDATYAVVVTRGHAQDEIALELVAGAGARYVGMIGSRRKVKYILDSLEKKGVDRTALDAVHAPIGLNLGGDTPAEIALSIMAEIQMVHNGGTPGHVKDVARKA